MSPQPTVSVVICTHNRVDRLRRCIDSFYRVNTNRGSELIIIDNASTDGTGDFIASLPERIGKFRLRTAGETKLGLSAAQNTGWRLASGEIIAFTDDDCYVRENFIDALVEAFEEDTTIGFIGGRILLYDSQD